ncbi:MAG: twin-arginine translocase subunit TatB [Rhodospirillaceae bacterium]|nr:MAG: twin-arginine translocase subunit TatB [Rhodospirillaceae bacterium]
MFDFAWSEIGLIGLVAVLVLGPKELPQAMRTLGRFTRQARKLAGEFQTHVNDLMREAELEDIKRSVDQVSTVNVGAEIDKLLDPNGELGPEFEASLAKAQQDMKIMPPPLPTSAPVAHTPEPSEVKAPPSEGHP